MPLINTKQMLERANKKGYAIPAFNVYNMESIKAVVEAAEKTKSDCIIAVSESAIKYAGLNLLVCMVKCLTEKSKTNFALHLDHGKSFEICKQCIDAGFTSVMIDGSNLPFEENIKLTKKGLDFANIVWAEFI